MSSGYSRWTREMAYRPRIAKVYVAFTAAVADCYWPGIIRTVGHRYATWEAQAGHISSLAGIGDSTRPDIRATLMKPRPFFGRTYTPGAMAAFRSGRRPKPVTICFLS